ncbi:hypothetical protein EBS02_08455, partial [bacterium]|nr:hypothetical protein [bacterium]
MKEETAISAGTPPTNSVSSGVETSLPPAVEPAGILRGSKVVRRWQNKKKNKIYEAAIIYAFMVTIADLGDIIVYAKNETQVRTKLRNYIRNTSGIININRIFATDVIDFYTTKRAKAMKRIPDIVLEMNQNIEADPQAAKQDTAIAAQSAKQDAAKRIQLAKQQAQKQLQQKKIEMQKNLANQQRVLQQKAKTGSLNTSS